MNKALVLGSILAASVCTFAQTAGATETDILNPQLKSFNYSANYIGTESSTWQFSSQVIPAGRYAYTELGHPVLSSESVTIKATWTGSAGVKVGLRDMTSGARYMSSTTLTGGSGSKTVSPPYSGTWQIVYENTSSTTSITLSGTYIVP